LSFGAVVKQGFDRRPRRFEQVAVAVPVEGRLILPVAVCGAHVRGVEVAPQLQVLASRKLSDLRGAVVELVEKVGDRVRTEGQADDANEHRAARKRIGTVASGRPVASRITVCVRGGLEIGAGEGRVVALSEGAGSRFGGGAAIVVVDGATACQLA